MLNKRGVGFPATGKSGIFKKFNERETHRVDKWAQGTHENVDAVPYHQDDNHHQRPEYNIIGCQARGQFIEYKPQNTAWNAKGKQPDIR